MKKYQCKWYGPKDAMHYTCPGTNVAKASITAFQKLWNCNNADDKLPENGIFSTKVEERLLASPIEGFPKTC